MDLEHFRSLALSFPAVTEDIKWKTSLCFCVGGKMFAICDLEANDGVSLKMDEKDFAQFSNQPGFEPAPYLARHHWIWVKDYYAWTQDQWKHYLGQSYAMVHARLPKKVRDEIAAGPGNSA